MCFDSLYKIFTELGKNIKTWIHSENEKHGDYDIKKEFQNIFPLANSFAKWENVRRCQHPTGPKWGE